ncbi:MAG: bifunctional phosphopantothenoylcysteine decarboxylase/phosphopantothenate--cysteine ligase CoaBC [Balneolales bacterium]|nr:bifunctional phosphopantothenoylcysteine decarboxylase/phosphopantothenate--cysteine ligase CoaBC [Balneolales bacterium]
MPHFPQLSGKKIILGVTGGIAAYKAVVLMRELQKNGAEVRCIATNSALRFIGKDTLAVLARHSITPEVFPEDGDLQENWTRHIQWGEWADIMVIAPLTANSLAKIVHGLADNMLTSTVLALRCPLLLCPAMDGGMYTFPSTKHNLQKALDFGMHILEPESGWLASGLIDKGRLPETEAILGKIEAVLIDGNFPKPLSGKKVLVSAGPTREYLDPVRFISNPSSGKMGVAMAENAANLGADVLLLHGPLGIALPKAESIKCISFTTAQDYFELVQKYHEQTDIFILSAAVSDFRPAHKVNHKVKKQDAGLQIDFEPTPDTLKWVGEHKKKNQFVIGFAMETHNLVASAQEKRIRKNADVILANTISASASSTELNKGDKAPSSGFETDVNELYLISNSMQQPTVFTGPKSKIAGEILYHFFSGDGEVI